MRPAFFFGQSKMGARDLACILPCPSLSRSMRTARRGGRITNDARRKRAGSAEMLLTGSEARALDPCRTQASAATGARQPKYA